MTFSGNIGPLVKAIRLAKGNQAITEQEILAFFAAHEHPPRVEDYLRDAKAKLAEPGDNISPWAPFDKDVAKAASRCFDRSTGRPVSANELKTYAEALARFHLRPQEKYLNGRHLDSGETARRRVTPLTIDIIGKETRRLSAEDPSVYEGFAPTQYATVAVGSYLRNATVKAGGARALARAIGVSPSHLIRVLNSLRPANARLVAKVRSWERRG